MILKNVIRVSPIFRTSTHLISSMAEKSCIFCDIVTNDEKNQILYQDETLIVFNDIRPAAKHHLLIVPKKHITDAKALVPAQKPLVEQMVSTANRMLTEAAGSSEGARMGFHWPPFHTVSHLHLHAIAPAAEMGFLSKMMFKENSLWFVSPEYVLTRLTESTAGEPQ